MLSVAPTCPHLAYAGLPEENKQSEGQMSSQQGWAWKKEGKEVQIAMNNNKKGVTWSSEELSCQEQSAVHVGIIIPGFHETMIPSGLRKTKSIVFNDFVPIITLNEQTTSFSLCLEKNINHSHGVMFKYETHSDSPLPLSPPDLLL